LDDDDDEPKPYGAGGGGYGASRSVEAGYGSGYGGSGSGGTGYPGSGDAYGYSDTASHGTYAQPPLSHESYPMHDFGPSAAAAGVGVGGVFDHGANGNGTGGGAQYDPFGMGVPATGDSPYPAFLHPSNPTSSGVGPGGYPVLGAGAAAVAGGAAGMAGIGRRSSMNNPNAVNRAKSNGTMNQPMPPLQQGESYASHYTPGYAGAGTGRTPSPAALGQAAFGSKPASSNSSSNGAAAGTGFTAGGAAFSSAVHDAAFGGAAPAEALPNPFTRNLESSDEGHDQGETEALQHIGTGMGVAYSGDEGHEEYDDEDPYGGYGSDEGAAPKVLKVANE